MNALTPTTCGHFEPIPLTAPAVWCCRDPQHNPPSMMVVPEGQRYVHTCPTCRMLSYLYPSPVTLTASVAHHPV
jgi:hypothetical protein